MKIGILLSKEVENQKKFKDVIKLVDFVQIAYEEYLTIDKKLLQVLKGKELHVHSISLSIGSEDVSLPELERIKKYIDKYNIKTWSDHIGFSIVGGMYTGMSMINPPFNTASVGHYSRNLNQICRSIGIPFLFENNSYCISYPSTNLSYFSFARKLFNKTGCKMLLDITNFNADINNKKEKNFISNKKLTGMVGMLHLAGGDWLDGYKTKEITRGHNKQVDQSVFSLLDQFLSKNSVEYIYLERSREVLVSEIVSDIKKIKKIAAKYERID